MEFLIILLTLLCYGFAMYLWWHDKTQLFFLTLLSGHATALTSPLWSYLYGVIYQPNLAVFTTVFNQPIFSFLIIASAWVYSLPALLVFYLYQTRWWFPGYISGLLTFSIFLLYHLLIETLGLRTQIWSYTHTTLAFSFPTPLLSAVMAALLSFALLYVLLSTYRYAWLSMMLALLPTSFALSVFIYGLLGAPLWISLLLQAQRWAVNIGMLSTLALLAGALHILIQGLKQADQGLIV